MADEAPWNVGRLLQWTSTYLKEHGSESARLDAEVLLAHVFGCQRIDLYTRFGDEPSDSLRAQFRELVKRRSQGVPVAYLVGYREFYSLRFRVSPAVLIPRPETEFVLIGLFDCIKAHGTMQDALRIADVGTGSGVLAVTAAKQLPSAQITAIDIQPEAIAVAVENAQDHQVADRIEWIQSDIFEQVPDAARFHYVISNPPYIGLNEKDSLPRDVRDHEPHAALFAGDRGLDVLLRLIDQCEQRLLPGGYLISEISPQQQVPLTEYLRQNPEFETPRFLDDLSKHPRVLQVRRT